MADRPSTRRLECCGGTDGTTTAHEPWCPAPILLALSWVEGTRVGGWIRTSGENALEALLEKLRQAEEDVARCAADTTAPDLAQDVEFLRAELAESLRLAKERTHARNDALDERVRELEDALYHLAWGCTAEGPVPVAPSPVVLQEARRALRGRWSGHE